MKVNLLNHDWYRYSNQASRTVWVPKDNGSWMHLIVRQAIVPHYQLRRVKGVETSVYN